MAAMGRFDGRVMVMRQDDCLVNLRYILMFTLPFLVRSLKFLMIIHEL